VSKLHVDNEWVKVDRCTEGGGFAVKSPPVTTIGGSRDYSRHREYRSVEVCQTKKKWIFGVALCKPRLSVGRGSEFKEHLASLMISRHRD